MKGPLVECPSTRNEILVGDYSGATMQSVLLLERSVRFGGGLVGAIWGRQWVCLQPA